MLKKDSADFALGGNNSKNQYNTNKYIKANKARLPKRPPITSDPVPSDIPAGIPLPNTPVMRNPNAARGQKIPDHQVPLQTRLDRADASGQVMGTKQAKARETYEESYPKRTVDDAISDKIRQKIEIKKGVEDAEKEAQYDKYGGRQPNDSKGAFNIPYITPALNAVSSTIRDNVINPAARALINRNLNPTEVTGTLAATTIAPALGGYLLYNNHKNKEAEKEKQAQAQGHRDKVQEIIAKRDLLLEQRQTQPQRRQAKVPYNFFSASPLVASANFEIGWRNPFFVKKEKALPLAAVAGGLIGTYGLLSKLNKQRALDAYKINGFKDKNAQDFASSYFDSPQYHADNLIREAANITGNPLLQGITDNPLDRLATAQPKKKSSTSYCRGSSRTANFFDPFITPAMALGSTAYGIYNKKKAADQQEEVFEAQKLAALGSITDKSLRSQLLAKAQGQVIDDYSRNRIIDSALNGDMKSAFRTGLKKVNWDSLQ